MDNTTDLQESLDNIILDDSSIVTTGQLRSIYAEQLANEPFSMKEEADRIANAPLNNRIFQDKNYNPEELPQRKDILKIATDITVDLSSVDNTIIGTSNKYAKLISGTISRLNNVKRRLFTNQQRISDINFICSTYSGISNIIPMSNSNVTGSYTYFDNTFSAFASTYTQVPIRINGVSGNGYSGNYHVLDSNSNYLYETEDRSNIYNLSDNSPVTVYEYSRICSSERIDADDVNYDNNEVICTISIASESVINCLKLDTSITDLKIRDVLTSNDSGMKYSSALSKQVSLTESMYNNFDYANGSNIICFPPTNLVKIVLSSNYAVSSEELGYTYADTSTGTPIKKIRKLNNAVRKVIQLYGITAYYNTYKDSVMITDNLAPVIGCNKVAIFANEYIPEYFSGNKDYIEYELIINGETYQVEPINSNKSGTKMISYSEYKYENTNALFLNEKIKTLQLRVKFNIENEHSTAYLGNLKLCIG